MHMCIVVCIMYCVYLYVYVNYTNVNTHRYIHQDLQGCICACISMSYSYVLYVAARTSTDDATASEKHYFGGDTPPAPLMGRHSSIFHHNQQPTPRTRFSALARAARVRGPQIESRVP